MGSIRVSLSLDSDLMKEINKFCQYHDLPNGRKQKYTRSFVFSLLIQRGIDSKEPIGKKGVGVASQSKLDSEEITKAASGEGFGRN